MNTCKFLSIITCAPQLLYQVLFNKVAIKFLCLNLYMRREREREEEKKEEKKEEREKQRVRERHSLH